MSQTLPAADELAIVPAAAVATLIALLQQKGFQPVGPTVRDGQLVLDTLAGAADLPQGWTTQADAGVFRLDRRPDQAFFGFNLGQESWKKFLFPAELPLFRARRQEDGVTFEPIPDHLPPLAFVGIRGCDLAALAVQDRTLREGPFVDPLYAARRRSLFIVAVNCTEADAACFCASLGTGPGVEAGFDLALTELLRDDGHYFLIRAGTARGAAILAGLPCQPATGAWQQTAADAVQAAARSQSRSLATADLPGLLYEAADHPRWDDIAARCLSCGNCALVCPTCFCYAVKDHVDLRGEQAERRRFWDVCHNLDHSYIHGGWIRTTTRSRYRQWLTHKLAAWIDQFKTLGCTGCGRCLVWCPVAIDLTEELPAFRAVPKQE